MLNFSKIISQTVLLAAAQVVILSAANAAGPTFGTRIVGGVPAATGELPYIVSLRTGTFGHFCGGSLIAQNWVLTAAHCAKGGTIDSVWIGMVDQKNTAGVEKIKPAKIIVNDKYDANTYDSDWALIQLSQNSSYEPVTLNEVDIQVDDTSIITALTAGWGALKESNQTLPNLLQKVEVPLVSNKVCNAKASYNGDVTDNMICAGYQKGGKDSCQGDSGGPLAIVDTVTKKHTLIGVVSWGEGCARANKYGVYSKVSAAIPWIKAQMSQP